MPARWTAPDGTVRTGSVKVGTGSARGTRITVWTDDQGALVAEPLPAPAAQIQAGTTGGAIALAICAGALLGCGITAKLLDRRRASQWATEWAEVGPQWDHRNA